MDKSNPTLYEKLQAYKDESAQGLNAFADAQKVPTPSFPAKIATVEHKNNDCPSPSMLNEELFEQFESNSQPLSDAATPSGLGSTSTYSTEGLGYIILRVPFLLATGVIICFELICYFILRQFVAAWEYLYVWRGKLGLLRQKLREAKSYDEWKEAALQLDSHMGKNSWRNQPKMAYYDHKLISDLLEKTSGFRKTGQIQKLMEILLQAGLRNNVGNIDSVRLYSNTYYGTKKVVENFLTEVTESLNFIGSSPHLTSSEKKRFFKAAFRNYGRSALCLSGGASLAYFHFGVVRTLLDNNMLPKIITGTSAGSMIAAMIACRSDDELRELLNPDMHILINACEDPIMKKLHRLMTTGTLFSAREFAEKCQWVTKGHTTFLEAYRMTGKILNITAVPYNSYGPTKLFNYLSTPNVVIWSAVLASSSIPSVLEPITLMIKMEDGTLEPYLGAGVKWRDGSIKTDIPIEALNAQFNVKYTIVSQANPHVAVFYYENRGSVGRPAAHRNGKGWRGGFLASSLEHYLKLDLKKWLRVLRDLELLPFIMKQDVSNLWLQKFDGNVTILPFISPSNYLHIVSDPTFGRMVDYFRNGAIKTWPKLHMIHNRTKIERTIFRWLNDLYAPNEASFDIPQEAHILPNGRPDTESGDQCIDFGIEATYAESNSSVPEVLHNNLLDYLMDIVSEEEEDSESSS
ncbi:hypothetical protein DSO57_1023230 [Entomophthora muscae]|uniref:Uncharacterized protein n=1 Tax=Entomophthora muscae TaxID=34485 RepID=A0ACC2UBZ7_9FUNG|nr:hypothetical protein DSO57_1023230 [Entomophthora muscae]